VDRVPIRMPVRFATTDDIPALARVINRAYVVEAHLFYGDRTDETEVRERLERPNACFLVIDAGDEGLAGDGAAALGREAEDLRQELEGVEEEGGHDERRLSVGDARRDGRSLSQAC